MIDPKQLMKGKTQRELTAWLIIEMHACGQAITDLIAQLEKMEVRK